MSRTRKLPGSERGPRLKPVKSSWVRTGGAIGDDSMDVGSEFDASGGGVSEKIKDVSADPNEGVRLNPDAE